MGSSTRTLAGPPIAERILAGVRARIAAAGAAGAPPTLASVHRRLETPFEVYRRRQEKVAGSLGIRFRDEPIDPVGPASALSERLEALATDPNVDAVIVEHPLPAPFDLTEALDRLPLAKDVDGISAHSLGRLWVHRPIHVPAVARAAAEFVRAYELCAPGTRAVVVGRSETVGLPIAHLLLERGVDATVTVAHSRTADLSAALGGAGLIVSCVGHPGLLTRANVPKGAAVVDVGLSAVPDPADARRLRSVGDADGRDLDGWAAALTPVPGGVGPVTVAMLMENVVRAWSIGRSSA